MTRCVCVGLGRLAVGGMVVLTTIMTTLTSYRSGTGGATRTRTSDLTVTVAPVARLARICRNALPTTSNPNVSCMLALGTTASNMSAACALSVACLSTRNRNRGGAFASGKGRRAMRGMIGGGPIATIGLAPGGNRTPVCFMVIGSAALHLMGSDLRRTIDSLGCSVVGIGRWWGGLALADGGTLQRLGILYETFLFLPYGVVFMSLLSTAS